ncbi:MAG: ATP-binding protein [Bacteroidales bacterium]
MKWWRNLLLNKKLALSYGVVIITFLLLGSFTIFSLFDYRKELSVATNAYIPLVDNTNKIERLTNQTMFALWEYIALDDYRYYEQSKLALAELSDALLETDRIISGSSELQLLRTKLVSISRQVGELNRIIDETAEIQANLKSRQRNLNRIILSYSKTSKQFLSKGESELWQQLSGKNTLASNAKERHRRNRLINVIVDKGNANMIAAFEAISFNNLSYLDPVFKEFKNIFLLLNRMIVITEGTTEGADVKILYTLFLSFRNETFLLKDNLLKHRELSVRRGEVADAVIGEARIMGQEGITLAGMAIQDKYKKFDKLITFFYIGLAATFLIALVFSVVITRSITIPLAKSVTFAEEIASGNYDAFVQANQKDEVGMLVLSLKNMGERLKENMEYLKKAEREKLLLSIETEERERKRFAEDLHDSLGPLLSTTKLYINALKDSAQSEERRLNLINSAEETLFESIATVKEIAYNLLPNLLSDFGLDMAVRSFCCKVSEASSITIVYHSAEYPTNLNRHMETTLFRVIKELVNNTIRHAKADRIDVKLYFVDEFLCVDYIDNGVGFDFTKERSGDHRGLMNIFNRVHYLNGKIDFVTNPGGGVCVTIKVEKNKLLT